MTERAEIRHKIESSKFPEAKNAPYLQNIAQIVALTLERGSIRYSPDEERMIITLKPQNPSSTYFSSFILVDGFEKRPTTQISVLQMMSRSEETKQFGNYVMSVGINSGKIELWINKGWITDSSWLSLKRGAKRDDSHLTVVVEAKPRHLKETTVNFLNDFTKMALENLRSIEIVPGRLRVRHQDYEVPTVDGTPENTTNQQIINQHLERIRMLDEIGAFIDTRSSSEYLRDFYGLWSFCDYAQSLNARRTVVDVGAGHGYAISELRRIIGKDLDFYATNLTGNDGLDKNIPRERVFITPAETMEGFEDESVGGILALNSIAYSASPEIVVKRFDQILVPGGILKARFRHPYDEQFKSYGFRTYEEFIKFWRHLGYDIATHKGLVVVAIKPGRSDLTSARKVMDSDLKLYNDSPFRNHWESISRSGERTYHDIFPARG